MFFICFVFLFLHLELEEVELAGVLVVGEASYHGAVSWSYRRDG